MTSPLNALRHRYHAFKAAVREAVQPRTTHVRLPRGSSFAIPRRDEIAARIANGTYEVEVVRFLDRALNRGGIAFDLGAHCGYFTLLMREAVGADGQVHSFEPSPRTCRRLSGNIRKNKYSNVYVQEAAVGAEAGSLILNAYHNDRAAYSTFGTPPFPDSVAVQAAVTTLDLYASEHSLDRIDLVKMDVEGSELEVLKGARRLLASHRIQVLAFEASDATLGSRGTGTAAVLDMLRSFDYALYDLDVAGRLTPIQQQPTYVYQNLVALAPGVESHAVSA